MGGRSCTGREREGEVGVERMGGREGLTPRHGVLVTS